MFPPKTCFGYYSYFQMVATIINQCTASQTTTFRTYYFPPKVFCIKILFHHFFLFSICTFFYCWGPHTLTIFCNNSFGGLGVESPHGGAIRMHCACARVTAFTYIAIWFLRASDHSYPGTRGLCSVARRDIWSWSPTVIYPNLRPSALQSKW